MTGAAVKYNFVFSHLKVVEEPANHPFKKQMDNFLHGVKDDLLISESPLKKIINEKLPAIFQLRLAALKWMKDEGSLIELFTKEPYIFFETMKGIKRFALLATHIIEVLELNEKIITSVAEREGHPGNISLNIPDVSLNQFIDTTYFSNPDEERATMLVDMAKCSLQIEYILLAAFIIDDEKLLVKDGRVIELSGTLASAVQAYSSLAASLDLITVEGPANKPTTNTKGAAIFSKMLADKRAISRHIKNGGELSELKDKYNFVNPLQLTAQ